MEEAKQLTLTLTINQLNVILSGIIKLPIEVALDTFNVIKEQADQQLGPPPSSSISGPLANKVI